MNERWSFDGVVLPYGNHVERWWIDGAVLREGRAPTDTARLPGRFLVPGLVDSHTHLTLNFDHGAATSASDIEKNLDAHLRAGVLAIRDTGVALGATAPRGTGRADAPDVIGGSHYIAPPDSYFPALAAGIDPELCAAAAVAEVEAGAQWVKVVADSPITETSFFDPPPTFTPEQLRRIVDAVHGVGGKVAAHTTGRSVSAVVAAGVDSIEHGSLLDREALRVMADRKIAWTPTVGTVLEGVAFVESTGHLPLIEIARPHLDYLRAAIPLAEQLGVTVLVGTDMLGHGNLVDEIMALTQMGMSPVAALAAASDVARRFFGFSPFGDGEPAEIVTYDADPREDPCVLRHPAAIVRAGHRVR